MTTNIWKRIHSNLSNHTTLYLSFFTIIIALFISTQFPVYFRTDGAAHLNSVFGYNNPLDVFKPYKSHFRPIVQLVWWLLYNLFGMNSFFYQLIILLLYGFSFILFFKLIELIFSKRIALFSLVSYFVVFFWLGYLPFIFANLTYLLHVFFINLSLYFIISAIKERGSFLSGIFFYICASLSKEPALVIIPAVTSFYLLVAWKDLNNKKRKQSVGVLAALCCIGFTGIIMSPLKSNDFSMTTGILDKINFMYKRWDYYSSYLISRSGIIIWISTFYLAIKSFISKKNDTIIMTFYFPLVLSIVISLILRPFPNLALLALFIAFIPLLVKRHKESLAIIWFSASMLGFMIILFINRTYLADASFGISILVGVALSDIALKLEVEKRRIPAKLVKTFLPILVIILFFGLIRFSPIFEEKLDMLQVVSNHKMNFKEMFNYISSNYNEPETQLTIVDYEDMGLDFHKDIFPLSDYEKAHRQKALSSKSIQMLFRVAGKQNISVHNLNWFNKNSAADRCLLLAMNSYEQDFIESLKLNKDIAYKTTRNGEIAVLYEVVK